MEHQIMPQQSLPRTIAGGEWPAGHVQGIAIDRERRHMYFSFTTLLVKTDLSGHILGTVEGLTGHLGCLAFNNEDDRVYGSLEYKAAKSFYIAIFDVSKIDRLGMNAEQDGIMTTVYLPDAADDFTADMDGNGIFDGDRADTLDHRYGCSGIDGVSFGPVFGGGKEEPMQLMVAYGIYSNTERADNDYQIILQYDWRTFHALEKPLNQKAPHQSGLKATEKYFLYTGNTTYGVQNLEYDAHTGNWLLPVYCGRKPQFPNYPMYIIDGSKAPQRSLILGQAAEEYGSMLSLLQEGLYHEASGVYGWNFPYGQTGIISLGDGLFYISHNYRTEDKKQGCTVHLYRWTGQADAPFELV